MTVNFFVVKHRNSVWYWGMLFRVLADSVEICTLLPIHLSCSWAHCTNFRLYIFNLRLGNSPHNYCLPLTHVHVGGQVMICRKRGPRVIWKRWSNNGTTTIDELIPFLSVSRSLGNFWSLCSGSGEYVVTPTLDVQSDGKAIEHCTKICLGHQNQHHHFHSKVKDVSSNGSAGLPHRHTVDPTDSLKRSPLKRERLEEDDTVVNNEMASKRTKLDLPDDDSETCKNKPARNSSKRWSSWLTAWCGTFLTCTCIWRKLYP